MNQKIEEKEEEEEKSFLSSQTFNAQFQYL